MKICELGSTGSSSFSKGMRNDAKKRDLIKHRQKLRNDIDDINSFMAVMASICPEYYEAKS